MFERFSDGARRVVVLAQEEARLLNHDYIGTEHLLLGLLQIDADTPGSGKVFDAFRFFELTHDGLRARVEELAPPGVAPSGHIPFTPRAKKALELSLREALALGDSTIGAEHLLLGILAEKTGIAVRVLEASGVEPEALRDKVIELRDAQGPRAEGADEPRVELRSAHATEGRPVAMMGTFGVAGGRPVPRCALCGRDEERCEHVLLAGGARLCSDCARAAVAQLDALPPDAPRLVRYRRPDHAPTDKDAAIAAIEHAFDAVLGPMHLTDDDALAYVEGGDGARDVLTVLRDGSVHAPMVPSDQTVERVRFLDESSAEVSLGLWMPGSAQPMLFPVHAVLEDGTWKVARSTLEHFASLAQQFRRPPF